MSINEDKPREVLAVESLTIELDALMIVRLCEDLLSVSRNLKESWLLGTLKVETEHEQRDDKEMELFFNKFNVLTDRIAELNVKQTNLQSASSS